MHRVIRTAAPTASLLSIAVAGCSGLPDRVDSVEQARESIDDVSREPLAERVAAEELAAARDALASADAAFEDRQPIELIEHRAYVAQRHADISRELVSEAHAREEIERGEAERNRVIAASRDREAEAAQRAAAEATRELENLDARDTDQGLVLTLGDVQFDTGQASLKPGAAATIDRLAQFMRDYPEHSVRIEGHTDSAGDAATNQQLSERRAVAVRDAVVARGVDAARIEAVGQGEARPIAGNDTASGRERNRRIEIVVSDDEGAFGSVVTRAGKE